MKKISEKTLSIILGSVFILSIIAIIAGGIAYDIHTINEKSKDTPTQIENMTEIENNVNDLIKDVYSVVFTEDGIQ